MLKSKWKPIQVSERQVTGFKKTDFFAPGKYWYTSTLKKEDRLKTGAKYAKKKGVHFGWMIPLEEWSTRLIHGDHLNPWPESIKDLVPFDSETDFPKFFKVNEALPEEKQIHWRPFQENFFTEVKTFLDKKLRYTKTLIAPLGAGKTLMGLGAIQLLNKPALVLAPTYLHDQWRREAKTWGFPVPNICTYAAESVAKWMDSNIEVLIMDENLRTKNPEAKRSQVAKLLASKCKIAIGMTGTPTSSKGAADWRHVLTGHPGAIPTIESCFIHIWGINPYLKWQPGLNQQVWVADGMNNARLAKFLEPYVFTVDKKEIEASLPSVNYITVKLPKPNNWDEIREGLYTERSFAKAIAQARQLTSGFYSDDDGEVYEDNSIKLNWIKEFIEDNPTEGIVIFSTHIASQRRLERELEEYDPAVIVADGRDTSDDLRRFQNGETKIMVCSSQLTEGMNLHKVSRTAIFESNGLSPVMRKQAIGRLERPNSAWSGVTIYDLCCEDTFDEYLKHLLTKHINFSENQIAELLKRKW
jgi:superfamily II DNA or RNA helicase